MTAELASKYTDSMPGLLNQLGIAVVVTTYQAGQVIIIREIEGRVNTHYTAMERPMGLAHFEDRMAIGGAYYLVEYYNMPDVATRIASNPKHDACYVPRRIHYTGDIDVHELAYGEGELWAINTKMSCLCIINNEHSFVPRWRPPFISAFDLSDRCHLNGLALKEGKPAYVTALGKSDTAAGWRLNKTHGGILIDVESDEIIAEGLSMPHSPRWYMHNLWYLESGEGGVALMNTSTGESNIVAKLPGFTRGLAFAGSFAFVGLSQVRETAVFAGLPLTERESTRNCGIWVVDVHSGKTVSFLTFTGNVQEIFSVGILPARMPAILGVEDPLVRTTYALPAKALEEVVPPDPSLVTHEKALQAYARKDFLSAISLLKQVITENPDFHQARFHLGVVLVDAEQWGEAVETLNTVVENDPKHAEAYNSLGMAYSGLQQWKRALEAFDRSVSSDRTFSRAQFNRSIVLFKMGNYSDGWKAFEWRWQLPEFTPFRCPQPQWQGEDIGDKTLLVHTEQGAGDAIQMSRFLPQVARRCNKLILVCPEALKDLFSTIDGIDEIRLPGNMPSDLFDVYLPIMSLGKVLNVSPADMDIEFPYLSAPEYISVPGLPNMRSKRVGLCWRGSSTHKNDHHRSCPLRQFARISEGIECEFFGLNLELGSKELALLEKNGIHNLEQELSSFGKTAAYLKQMDLVISIDSACAHLAGALDVPVWNLLSTSADWRWGLAGSTTGWYPGMTLYRQHELDNWAGLIDEVRHDLKRLA
ncbi:TIGR03032 family protein [Pseudomonadota bacterium]